MSQPSRLRFERNDASPTEWVAGESGPSVTVTASTVQGMCADDMNGKVKQVKFETELTLTLNKSKCNIEVLEMDYSKKVTVDVPNDTVTHRARNSAGLYKNMAFGESR